MSGPLTGRNSGAKSLFVGLLQWALLGIGIVDSSQPDQNIWYWLYAIFGIFILMPIQCVFLLKLVRAQAPLHCYVGVMLSVASLALATFL